MSQAKAGGTVENKPSGANATVTTAKAGEKATVTNGASGEKATAQAKETVREKATAEAKAGAKPFDTIKPKFFLEHLHLMFSKTSLTRMIKEASYEESLVEKQQYFQNKPEEALKLSFKSMIVKLETLFDVKKGGGMTLEKLKDNIRKRIAKIKPRA